MRSKFSRVKALTDPASDFSDRIFLIFEKVIK